MDQYDDRYIEEDETNQAYVFSAYITTKKGRRIYASAYGLTAFRFKARTHK